MEKSNFLEKLGINNFFGNLAKTEWISGIDIDEKRKVKIQSCFSNETEVHIAKEPDELDSLIETLKLRTRDIVDDNDVVNSLFGENKKMDRLIVMDDVSGVADISKKFATFKTEWISRIDIDEKKRQKFNHALVIRQKFILQKNRMNLIL